MATYYVKIGGGTGNGTDFASAWSYDYYNSIANTSKFPAGSGLNFYRGETYNGPIVVRSGTDSINATTYGTYGSGANPIISGFTTLSSWSLYGGNIYYASLNFTQVQLVTLDGVLKPMGTYPSNGTYLQYTSSTASSITGTSVGSLPSNFPGGEVVIKKYRYIIDRHKITGRSGSTLNFSSTNFYGNNSNYVPTDNNGFFIQNHVSTLVKEGDWAYDAATSRLYMHFGTGTPSGRVVKVCNNTALSTLNSSAYVTFNNIDFEGGNAGFINNGTNGITFNTCNFRKQATGIYLVDTINLNVQGCSFNDNTNLAIFGENNCHNITVDSCNIQNIGLFPGMGESGDGKLNAIGIEGGEITITNNIVQNIGFNGIAFGGSNVLVEHNYVNNFNIHKDDGAGIYTFIQGPYTDGSGVYHNQIVTNRKIKNNIVLNAIGCPAGAQWNGDSNGEAAAIYLDGYSNGVEVSGNQCAHGPWAGIFVNANFNHTILNNLAYDYAFSMLFVNTAQSGFGRVQNVAMTGNKFIARYATQRALQISMHVTGVSAAQMGTFNNNYYARPILDTNPINFTTEYNSTNNFMTVAAWKTYSSQDANSSKSLVVTDADNKLRFESNPTNVSTTVSLGAIYKDVTNTSYNGSAVLQAYGSNLFIYDSAGGNSDTTAPTIQSVFPASGAISIFTTTNITVTFSEAMLASTINTTSFSLKQGSTPIAGTVSYSGNTATFTPSATLAAGTLYTATITTAVKDAASNALVSNYTWTFTTKVAGTGKPVKNSAGKLFFSNGKIIVIE